MRSVRIRTGLGIFFLLGNAGGGALHAAAQSDDPARFLLETYQAARLRVEARDILSQRGLRVEPLPPARLPWIDEGVRERMAALEALRRPPPDPPIRSVRLTPAAEIGAFDDAFRDTQWTYLGSNERIPSDTIRTRDLRALLEARFGPPTRTLAEHFASGRAPSEYIQFEYRFVLNDSIPLMLLDVNGPFERGVVAMTDRKYRERLPRIKAALLDSALEAAVRAPYADYYYVAALESWFLTGFDGERFFLERIPAPDMKQGRPSLYGESDR